MYINIQLVVPPESLKTALKFFKTFDTTDKRILNQIKQIDEIDVTNFDSLSNFLSTLQSTANLSRKPVRYTKNKYGRSVIKVPFGWDIVDKVTYTIRQTLSYRDSKDLTLHISFDVCIAESTLWIRRGDFSFNFENKIWIDELTGNTGKISIRDNNVPIGINTHGELFHPHYMINRLDKRILLSIAIMPESFYTTPYIDYDVIEFARNYCLENNIIEQEDLDYIDEEVKYLLSGKQHEINI